MLSQNNNRLTDAQSLRKSYLTQSTLAHAKLLRLSTASDRNLSRVRPPLPYPRPKSTKPNPRGSASPSRTRTSSPKCSTSTGSTKTTTSTTRDSKYAPKINKEHKSYKGNSPHESSCSPYTH